MRHRAAVIAAAALLGVVLALVPHPVMAADAETLFPLHVSGGSIVGPAGQEVILRGVNSNGLVQYAPSRPEAVPLTAASVHEMAAMGFDFLRLPLSLSALEPEPGQISQAYLGKIAQILGWAQASGIWVLVDLHQDRYAAGLFPGESDGMPPWMVDTLGLPKTPTLLGVTNPAVQGAFTAFWSNRTVDGTQLWSAYMDGLTALATAFGRSPALAGYDVMNEPNPGFYVGSDFVTRYLLPFYARAVQAIRRLDPTHPIFLEPDIVSMATLELAWPQRAFLRQGIVFEPHEYLPNGSFLQAHGVATKAVTAQLLAQMYEASNRAAAALSLPWFVGEFGAATMATGNAEIQTEVELQDQYGVGSALWLWQIKPGTYPWQLVKPDGGLIPDRTRLGLVASPHPLTVGGRLVSMRYAPAGSFSLQMVAAAAAGPTVVLASSLTYPHGIEVKGSAPWNVTAQTEAVPGATLTLWRLTLKPTTGPVTLTILPRGAATSTP